VLLPSFYLAHWHLSCSYILKSVFDFICCLEKDKVPLNHFKVFHAILLKTHQEQVVINLAEFSAFRQITPQNIRFNIYDVLIIRDLLDCIIVRTLYW
jgi:hypothetical protein